MKKEISKDLISSFKPTKLKLILSPIIFYAAILLLTLIYFDERFIYPQYIDAIYGLLLILVFSPLFLVKTLFPENFPSTHEDPFPEKLYSLTNAILAGIVVTIFIYTIISVIQFIIRLSKKSKAERRLLSHEK